MKTMYHNGIKYSFNTVYSLNLAILSFMYEDKDLKKTEINGEVILHH